MSEDRTSATRVAVAAAVIVVGISAISSGVRAQPPYADTEWHTIHATSRNNDYVPMIPAPRYEQKWRRLDGAVTVMGPSLGPEGNLYITTLSDVGTSTFYAFDAEGNVLWNTPPWQNGPTDFDSCAGFSTPVIDDAGDIYIGDCNQFWAFHPDGTTKWVIDLPVPPPDSGAPWQDFPASPINAFVTAFITLDGSVGGVTVFGDIVIVSREDGSPAAPVTPLPGSIYDIELGTGLGEAPPPGLWAGGLTDPAMIPVTWYVFDGATPSANTPAVVPSTGRIFVTGFSAPLDDENGALYGLDFTPGQDGGLGTIDIPISFEMGPGSGSSPGVSPDDQRAYVSDGEGVLYAVDADSGNLIWELDSGTQPASPTVGPDGTIYLLSGKAGRAINSDGSVRWVADLDEWASTRLPPSVFPAILSDPTTFNNAINVATDGGIMTGLTVGYSIPFIEPLFGNTLVLPVEQAIVTLDADTGEMIPGIEPFFGNDTCEGFVIPRLDQTVYMNDGALTSSIFGGILGLFKLFLPRGVTLLEAGGGFEAFAPAPPRDRVGIEGLVDGELDDGDLIVELEPPGSGPGVIGAGTVGTTSVVFDIRRQGSRFRGTITVSDGSTGLDANLKVNTRSIDVGLGPNVAGGEAAGDVSVDGRKTKVTVPWVVEDIVGS